MKLGLILDFDKSYSETNFTNEVVPFINFLHQRNHEVYGIDVTQPTKIDDDKFTGYNFANKKEEVVDLDTLAGIDVGIVGQGMPGIDTSLTQNLGNLGEAFRRLERYRSKGGIILNPPETIAKFISKRYLLGLQDSGLPVITTREITNLDELLSLRRNPEPLIVKPLVAERSNGTRVLTDMSEDEIRTYFSRYSATASDEHPEQGIIIQPYDNSFRETGEAKIGIVNGEITLSRLHNLNSPGDQRYPIVASGRTDVSVGMTSYTPTQKEQDIALAVNKYLIQTGVIFNYLRVDIAGGKISEIELINPSYAIKWDGLHPTTKIERHFENKIAPYLRARQLRLTG